MEYPTIQAINSLSEQRPPLPWKEVGSPTIHSLMAVGYAPDSDLILVVTMSRLEVFDGLNGNIVAWVDTSHDDTDPFDAIHLTARGIGPLDGQSIRVASWESGGGLPKQTADGWQIKIISCWPNDTVLLFPEKYSGAFTVSAATKLFGGEREIVAAGFSETGKSFIIAEPSAITIYSRS
jgi:hypothetical protein